MRIVTFLLLFVFAFTPIVQAADDLFKVYKATDEARKAEKKRKEIRKKRPLVKKRPVKRRRAPAKSADQAFEEYYGNPKPAPAPRKPAAPAPRAQPAPAPVPEKRLRPKRKSVSYSRFFGFEGHFYLGVDLGQTMLMRGVKVISNKSGDTIYRKDNNEIVGTANGETYTFQMDDQYMRTDLKVGFQKKKEGDFFQLSYYSNDVLQETYLSYGITFPEAFEAFKTTVPFVKLDGGFGHTDSKDGLPVNYAVGLGLGGYTRYFTSWRLFYGIDYHYRPWLDLREDFGTERWTDQDVRGYLGVNYLFKTPLLGNLQEFFDGLME